MKIFTSVSAKLLTMILIIGVIVRIMLICITPGELGLSFGQWVGTFGLGAINDLCVGVLSLTFMWLFLLSVSRRKYGRRTGYAILGVLTAALIYVLCFNTVFDEYGSVVPHIVQGVLGFWAAGFALRFFVPAVRAPWTKVWFWIISGLYVLIIYFNGAGEYFFWDEFNVRYNFIAVDYLIYTNEVVGNIMESYAMVPLSIAVLTITVATTWLLFRNEARHLDSLTAGGWKLKASGIYVGCAALALAGITFNTRFQQTGNTYYDELQANGAYKFFDAFRKNHLDYGQFYYALTPAEAEGYIHGLYGSHGINTRHIMPDSALTVTAPGIMPNIVLVTMESMSASYMERYGDDRHITPNLDSLARKSLVFDRLFATGNRTVRGLEALSLSLPPSPGESIVKRPDCGGMRTTGVLLGEMGYRPMYFYGGNSYFDNMGTYFGSNGYEVIDVKNYQPGEITFQNIWGVADENAYDKALSTLDDVAGKGKPFFAQIMTISNHRPFTYPEGRIPIPADSKKRAGGVMYSDWALGRFIDMASEKQWFDNTVFVIVADHCASSAGKTELPLDKYHIPAMIYAPGMIEPRAIDAVCSQIDLIPTLFALLGFEYDSSFYGQNILGADFSPRAYMATYENLGYLENDTLTVLSPVKRIEQFRRVTDGDDWFATEPVNTVDSVHVKKAAAFYQTSANWYAPKTK